jgi:hypothetical protein
MESDFYLHLQKYKFVAWLSNIYSSVFFTSPPKYLAQAFWFGWVKTIIN